MMNDHRQANAISAALRFRSCDSWPSPALQLELEPQDEPSETYSTGTPEQLTPNVPSASI